MENPLGLINLVEFRENFWEKNSMHALCEPKFQKYEVDPVSFF
jgi:hypothetical protein